MPLETGTYISDLVTTNPAGTDTINNADDHLRLIKSTIKTTFPNITGAVTPTHTELNYVAGVTSAIQTQLTGKASTGSVLTSGLTQSTARLLGRTTAAAGAIEEITVGSNLSFATGTLNLAASPTVTSLTTTTLNASGDVNLTGTGAVQVPSGTTAQRPTPTTGDFRFNTSTSTFEGYNGTAWGAVGGGATGGGSDAMFYLNGKTITTTYSIPSNNNAMTAGPITINSGVTVTVPSGSRWIVL